MNRSFSAHDLAAIAMSVALIAVCSWISVPTTIPFTMQTFAVCLVAAVFGLRHGVWAVLCYILLGAVGAPVFAGFSGGFGVLLGTTGGYILGFVFTALIVGFASEKLGRRIPVLTAAMTASADVLVFKSGSRLVGKVDRIEGGEIKFKSDDVGDVSVKQPPRITYCNDSIPS